MSESRAMVPDTEQRLKAAVTDLGQFLVCHSFYENDKFKLLFKLCRMILILILSISDIIELQSTHRELEGSVEYETAQRELSAVEAALC